MKLLLRLTALAALFFLTTHSTASYVRTPLNSANGTPIAWNLTNPNTPIVVNGRIVYNLNPAGSDDLPFAEVERALAASFQSWEDVPTSSVAFTRGANSSSTQTTADNMLQIFWLENTTNTGDGLDVAGVVALSRVMTISSGPRTGEIVDAALVFNGNQFTWATDGRGAAVDVQEIATHEIGHLIGLAHSPIGGAAMFPRTGAGRTQGRTLAFDDQIAASVAYPAPGFRETTGVLRGRVQAGDGGNIFGAHVVAVDANGVAIAGALAYPDGSYAIEGLPPGRYSVYAEPLDPVNGAYFSRFDLSGFFSNITTDFQTTGDLGVDLGLAPTTLDITAARVAQPFDGYLVFDRASGSFFNIGALIKQGETRALIGVAGPNLPQSGTPLTVSGPGFTIGATSFNRTGDGLPLITAEITVSTTAPIGPHNIIISDGAHRTILTGALNVIAADRLAPAVVSAANFAGLVAAESIASAFGQNLATTALLASTNPLPRALGGTSVRLRDNAGNEHDAPLFFVSPAQVNFQIAPGIQNGPVTATITNGAGDAAISFFNVEAVAPGLFSANGTGRDLAAAIVFRRRADGQENFEPVARFDPASSQTVSVPIDLGTAGDQVFLLLFGTGVRFRNSLGTVNFNIGGVMGNPVYAGAQGDFVGLDQINIPLTGDLAGRGTVNVNLSVDGKLTNTVTINIR